MVVHRHARAQNRERQRPGPNADPLTNASSITSLELEEYEQEVLNAEITRKIHDLRTKVGISQRELARRVGRL